MKRRSIIGVTAGDPAGIGPEILLAALQKFSGTSEIRIIGNVKPCRLGKPSQESAELTLQALEEAAHLALRGEVDALVTGPISKHYLHRIGFSFPGQTEFFAARAGIENFAMLLTGGKLTVALTTIHEPLRKVATLLCPKEIVRVGKLMRGFFIRCGMSAPRIAVAGLNPHAGESGDIGREEIEIISPAIAHLEREFPQCFTGPHAPDTVFYETLCGRFDGVLCMYHDQGLIPLKLHAFDEGVNVTLGLPFIRTSPDHGTAYSIAGQGLARSDSMLAALYLAEKLIN